jgi:class 3 adenylate cyclase
VKFEVIEVHRMAIDQDGTMLVWAGPLASAPPPAALPSPSASDPVSVQPRASLAYTPPHLAEKILTARGALEGERRHVTILFADTKGSMELIQGLDPKDV